MTARTACLPIFVMLSLFASASQAACDGGVGHTIALLLTHPDIILVNVAKNAPGLKVEMRVFKTFRGTISGILEWDLRKERGEDDADSKLLLVGKTYLIGGSILRPAKISISNCDFILEQNEATNILKSLEKSVPPMPSETDVRQIRLNSINQALDAERKSRSKSKGLLR